MKLILFYFLLTIFLLSCTKNDTSNVNAPCSDSCTTVQGRFWTGSNEPISGLSLEVRSERRPTLGLGQTTIRKIATGNTDNNGFYSFTFSVKPEEYGRANTYLFLSVNYDKTRFLSIPWYNQFGTVEIIPIRVRRDTTLKMDYYFASKAHLKLQLNNFIPVSIADSFYILPVYHDVGYNKEQVTEPQFFVATQVINEKVISIAGNQQNKISVVRKKSGIRITSDTLIFTPTNQITNVTFNY